MIAENCMKIKEPGSKGGRASLVRPRLQLDPLIDATIFPAALNLNIQKQWQFIRT